MLSRGPTLVVALVFALILAVGVAINMLMTDLAPTDNATAAARRLASLPDDAPWALNKPADALSARDPNRPAFDILRIDPSGQSVFAGRAAPDAEIAILAGDREIARTRAASDGTWSIVTGSVYTGGNVAFRVAATKDGRTATSEAVVMSVPVTPAAKAAATRVASVPKAKPAEPSRDGTANDAATRALERLVDEVRSNPAAANNPYRAPEIIPLPITFESGQSIFTSEGRRAAGLLVEYVKGAGLGSITLSGHADERGPDRYNMRLSRKRLEAIAAYLRAQGYSGKLNLLAKGESEPFAGVDRPSTPRELLWRVDRRVELRTR